MDEMAAREFGRRYQETYIRYRHKPKDPWKTALVHRAEHTGGNVVDLKLEDVKGNIDRMESNTIELNLDFPETGFVQTPSDVVLYLERAPQRQWKWGLCGNNSHITPPFYNYAGYVIDAIRAEFLISPTIELVQGAPLRHILNQHVADAAYNRTYLDYDAAITKLSKQAMIALSRHHAVSVSIDSPDYLFWIGKTPVASIKANNPKEIVCRDIFKQEVVDYFTRLRRFDIYVQ